MTKARDIADSDLEDLVVQNDVEVSGGIFLGGTGSANKLDDYEEGTWTPTSPDVTFSNAKGYYVKVGSVVHITAQIEGVPSNSNSFVITGLPLDGDTTKHDFARHSLPCVFADEGVTDPVVANFSDGLSLAVKATFNNTLLTYDDFNGSNGRVSFSGHYFVDS